MAINKFKRYFFPIIVCVLSCTIFSPSTIYTFEDFGNPSLAINGDWWNDDWAYRKTITITNTAGKISDYQIRLEINDQNLYQNSLSNGEDIRFIDVTNNELVFFIDKWNTNGSSIFWVRVSEISADSVTNIFLYYGNPEATSQSNEAATFHYIDDFTTDTWTHNNSNMISVLSSSELLSIHTDRSRTDDFSYRLNPLISNVVLKFRFNFRDLTESSGSICIGFSVGLSGSLTDYTQGVFLKAYGGTYAVSPRFTTLAINNGHQYQYGSYTPEMDKWYTIYLKKAGLILFLEIWDNQEATKLYETSQTLQPMQALNYLYVCDESSSTGIASGYLDDIRLSNSASTEPTVLISELNEKQPFNLVMLAWIVPSALVILTGIIFLSLFTAKKAKPNIIKRKEAKKLKAQQRELRKKEAREMKFKQQQAENYRRQVASRRQMDSLRRESQPQDDVLDLGISVAKQYGQSKKMVVTKSGEIKWVDSNATSKQEEVIKINDEGISLINQNKLEAAIEVFKRAIALDNDYAFSYGNLASCYSMLLKYSLAEENYLIAIEKDPSVISFYSGLGSVYTNTKRFDEAEKCFEKAREIDPNNLAYRMNYGDFLFFSQGFKHLEQKTVDYHIELLKSGIIHPEDLRRNAIIHYRMGMSLVRMGKSHEAIEIANEYLSKSEIMNSEHFATIFTQIKVAAEINLNQFEEAKDDLLMILDKYPNSAILYVKMGDLLSKQQSYQEAISNYQKALDLGLTIASGYNQDYIKNLIKELKEKSKNS